MCCRASASVMSERPDPLRPLQHARSMRPPPEAHDSQSMCGKLVAQGVQHPVEREGLLAHGRGPTPTARAGLEKLAVVVPLDVVDRARGEHRAHLIVDVLPHLRPGQVQHQLVAVQLRHPITGRQHPVGVSAIQLGVGIDHLGLEPEPELHAEPIARAWRWASVRRATPPGRPTSRPARRCRRGGHGTSRRPARTAPPRPGQRGRRSRAAGSGRGRTTPPPRR